LSIITAIFTCRILNPKGLFGDRNLSIPARKCIERARKDRQS
jgi:hypothetical protein